MKVIKSVLAIGLVLNFCSPVQAQLNGAWKIREPQGYSSSQFINLMDSTIYISTEGGFDILWDSTYASQLYSFNSNKARLALINLKIAEQPAIVDIVAEGNLMTISYISSKGEKTKMTYDRIVWCCDHQPTPHRANFVTEKRRLESTEHCKGWVPCPKPSRDDD